MKTTRRFNQNRFFSYVRIAIAGTLVTTGAAMAFVATKPSAPDVGPAAPENGVYIVQMIAAPAVSYTGGIAGYNATAPRRGQKINPLESNTLRYVGYLKSKHDQLFGKFTAAKRSTIMRLVLMALLRSSPPNRLRHSGSRPASSR